LTVPVSGPQRIIVCYAPAYITCALVGANRQEVAAGNADVGLGDMHVCHAGDGGWISADPHVSFDPVKYRGDPASLGARELAA
jgi:hypothetical protein